MELLIVILIISILAAMALSALAGATELAREQRTRVIINKIDQLIGEQYEGYRTRAVPIRVIPGVDPISAARLRLYALRDVMRMELPDRITDVVDGPATITVAATVNGVSQAVSVRAAQPAAWKSYRRRALRELGANWATAWTDQHQGAECLYLILSQHRDGDKSALDFFLPQEIGDVDADGMKEILDAWGQPIEFLRWAPAYLAENDVLTFQTEGHHGTGGGHVDETPDPFDPMKADERWRVVGSTIHPYALYPLIFSAGRDRKYDVATKVTDANGNDLRYAMTLPPNDPYYVPTSGDPLGKPGDIDQDGYLGYGDNITNHYQSLQ
jgi:hypothetical protein